MSGVVCRSGAVGRARGEDAWGGAREGGRRGWVPGGVRRRRGGREGGRVRIRVYTHLHIYMDMDFGLRDTKIFLLIAMGATS